MAALEKINPTAFPKGTKGHHSFCGYPRCHSRAVAMFKTAKGFKACCRSHAIQAGGFKAVEALEAETGKERPAG